MRYFLFLSLVFSIFSVEAQEALVGYPTSFRSVANPHYWKNKMPTEGYWQQDVHYEIRASVDDSTDIVDAEFYELTYWNNSPDELNELYFHLFANAFQPGSHYHELWKQNDQEATFGAYEKAKKNLEISMLTVNGKAADTVYDNTILKVVLNTPLKPGGSVKVQMKFKQYFDMNGSMRRRMKMYTHDGVKHYDGVHWYPSVCVYDHKFGWTTEQHLDKEFYHDFGSFDVQLTFPHHYIVDATGLLQNRGEAMPDELRKALDIRNFKDKPWGEKPSIVIEPEEGKTRTWHFYAQNVHNFAFTADPTYRIGEVNWNGVIVRSLAQEPHASRWQLTAPFTAEIIRIYSEDFGMYAWPKIIAADAKDGMEYPMLTLDGGAYPGHQGLIAHEVGHMWFYGMLGSNEAYRAFMDEGFTQFLTAWSQDALTGSKPFIGNMPYHRFASSHYPYIKTVREGFDYTLNTHSSDFHNAVRQGGGYGLVYVKASTMLFNLKYVLGDSLFREAMQHYVEQWKFCHPYPEDFRENIINFTGADLNWFFDQWLETTKEMDYGIKKVKRIAKDSVEIVFERKGEMQMPVDFDVYTKAGDTLQYHIPNTWFEKPTERTVLPKWYGFAKMYPEHRVVLPLSENVVGVQFDPEELTGDVNRLNNKWARPNKMHYLSYNSAPSYDWNTFHHYLRPALWYYAYDGLKAGVNLSGQYMNDDHRYDLTVWGSGIGQTYYPNEGGYTERNKDQFDKVSYRFTVDKNLRKHWKGLSGHMKSEWNTGAFTNQLWLTKIWRRRDNRNPNFTRMLVGYKSMIRHMDQTNQVANSLDKDNLYLLNPVLWGSRTSDRLGNFHHRDYHNSSIFLSFNVHRKRSKRDYDLGFTLRAPVFTNYNYSYLDMSYAEERPIWKDRLVLKTRLFNRLGTSATLHPNESLLYLAGGNPEEMNTNRFTRARGFIPVAEAQYEAGGNNFQYAGGLNLRGYAGRIFQGSGFVGAAFSGAAINSEFDFQNVFGLRSRKLAKYFALRTYLFADAGLTYEGIGENNAVNILGSQGSSTNIPYTDAGLGSALTINFGKQDRIQPITLRFDMPIYLNRPHGDEESFAFRYVFGVNTLF